MILCSLMSQDVVCSRFHFWLKLKRHDFVSIRRGDRMTSHSIFWTKFWERNLLISLNMCERSHCCWWNEFGKVFALNTPGEEEGCLKTNQWMPCFSSIVTSDCVCLSVDYAWHNVIVLLSDFTSLWFLLPPWLLVPQWNDWEEEDVAGKYTGKRNICVTTIPWLRHKVSGFLEEVSRCFLLEDDFLDTHRGLHVCVNIVFSFFFCRVLVTGMVDGSEHNVVMRMW